MPNEFRQSFVQCPFYKYADGRRRITCEGLIDKSSIALLYLTRRDYDTQLLSFCCDHYRKCEIYRMLMENKYEEEC